MATEQDLFLQYWSSLTPQQQAQILAQVQSQPNLLSGGGYGTVDRPNVMTTGTGAQTTAAPSAPATTAAAPVTPPLSPYRWASQTPFYGGGTWQQQLEGQEPQNFNEYANQALAQYNAATGQKLTLADAQRFVNPASPTLPEGWREYWTTPEEGQKREQYFFDPSGTRYTPTLSTVGVKGGDWQSIAQANPGLMWLGDTPVAPYDTQARDSYNQMDYFGPILAALGQIYGAGALAGGLDGGAAAGAGGLAGAEIPGAAMGGTFVGEGTAGLAGAGGLSAADLAGLTQMGQAAGLQGAALEQFVASGGALGSTAAGGGGIGLGASKNFLDPWDLQPDPYNTYNTPQVNNSPLTSPATPGGPNIPSAPPGSGTAISRVFNALQNGQTPNAGDVAQLLGGLGSTALGYLGANAQTDAYKDIANQYLGIGAPYRGLLNASYQPGFDLRTADPAYAGLLSSTADAAARSVSATEGNPALSPGAMQKIQESVYNRTAAPYLSNYRGQLGQFGGLGLNTAGTAGMAGASGATTPYNVLAGGLGLLTQQDEDIPSLLRKLQGSGLNLTLNTGRPQNGILGL